MTDAQTEKVPTPVGLSPLPSRMLAARARPWPKSIGMINDGTLDPTTVKDWIHEEWSRNWDRWRGQQEREGQ